MNRIVKALVVLVATGVGLARADVKVQEKSQVKFEGAMGTVQRMMGKEDASPSTVAVRGDRKRTLGESSGESIGDDGDRLTDIYSNDLDFGQVVGLYDPIGKIR